MTVNELAKELHCRPKAIIEAMIDLSIAPSTVGSSTEITRNEADQIRTFIDEKSTVVGLAKSVAARFGEEI